MAKVFKVTPKRVKRSNGLVRSTEGFPPLLQFPFFFKEGLCRGDFLIDKAVHFCIPEFEKAVLETIVAFSHPGNEIEFVPAKVF